MNGSQHHFDLVIKQLFKKKKKEKFWFRPVQEKFQRECCIDPLCKYALANSAGKLILHRKRKYSGFA